MARRRIDAESIPFRKLIPNLMTAGALCAGIASFHFSITGQFDKAMGCIAASFVLDGLDGRAARFLRVTSRFGEVIDSISDFTAFGVAPAFLLYQWQLQKDAGVVGLLAVALYALCAAIRLARFTVQARKQKLGGPPGKFFQGLPAPAAAGAALVPPMLALSETVAWKAPAYATAVYTLMLAAFMVSKLPMISVKGMRISRKLVVPLMLFAGVLTIGLVRDGWLTLSALATLYLLSFPAGWVLHARSKNKPAPPADGGPEATGPAGQPPAVRP